MLHAASCLSPPYPFLRQPFRHTHAHAYTYSQTEQGLAPLFFLQAQAHKIQNPVAAAGITNMHFRSTNRLFRLLRPPHPATATQHHRTLSSKSSSNFWLSDKSVSIYINGCICCCCFCALYKHIYISISSRIYSAFTNTPSTGLSSLGHLRCHLRLWRIVWALLDLQES